MFIIFYEEIILKKNEKVTIFGIASGVAFILALTAIMIVAIISSRLVKEEINNN